MQDQLKERCIYCGADVFYTGAELLIKCGMCGHTLAVAKFENELARMNAAIEEGEAAKRALKEAEKEKQAAEERLFAALSQLGDLQDGQNKGLKVLQKIVAGQEDADSKAKMLSDLSRQIVDSQNDIMTRLQMQTEIVAQLQAMKMEADEQKDLMNDFILWCQTARAEDYDCLKDIESSSAALLAEQRVIGEKIDQLQQTAGRTQQTVEDFRKQYTRDKLEKLRNLWRQAENCQHDRAYDKAEEYYRQIAVEGGADAEIYWRLILCHYCVSYQQDDHGNMIPIILNPDLTDPDQMSLRLEFLEQLKKTGTGQGEIYSAELEKIDRILDKYRQVCHQVHYDVFISVQQNEDGHYTADSDIASDIYDFLTSQGLKVFNSRRTKIPAGHEYEPYIIAALMSAKVMVVVGTSPEHMNSQWVRNEWMRFQWLRRNEQKQFGKTRRLLLCYLAGPMSFSDIPHALNPDRQAIKSGLGAESQLLQAIDFLKKTDDTVPPAESVKTEPKESFEQVMGQLTTWLYAGRYDQVLKRYEEYNESGSFLQHARLHICALCALKQVEDIEQLVYTDTDLSKEPYFRLAMKLADSGEQKYLQKLLENNRKWVDQKSKEKDSLPERIQDEPKKPVPWKLVGIAAAVICCILIVFKLLPGGWGGSEPAEPAVQTETTGQKAAEAVDTEVEGTAAKASEGMEGLITPEKLTVGMSMDYPPFEYYEEDGKTLTGFDVELAKAIADANGLEPELVNNDWDAMFSGLQGKKYDVVISGALWNEERAQDYLTSEPYLYDRPVFISLRGETISSVDDLEGMECYPIGYDSESLDALSRDLEAWNVPIVEDALAAPEAWFECILSGPLLDLNLFIYTSSQFYGAYKDRFMELREAAGIDPSSLIVSPVTWDTESKAGQYCFWYDRQNTDLKTRMDETLTQLKADGTLAALSEKYFGTDQLVP